MCGVSSVSKMPGEMWVTANEENVIANISPTSWVWSTTQLLMNRVLVVEMDPNVFCQGSGRDFPEWSLSTMAAH